MKELAENFKAARIKAGLQQEQLAEKSGVLQCTISRYENGKQDITIATAKKLANALKSKSLIKLIQKHLIESLNS